MKTFAVVFAVLSSGIAHANSITVSTKVSEHARESTLETKQEKEELTLDTRVYSRSLDSDRYYGVGLSGTLAIEKINEVSLGGSLNVLNEDDRETAYSLGLCRWVSDQNQLCLNSSYATEQKPEAEVLNSDFDLVKIPADSNIVSNEITHRILINPTMTALYGVRYQKSARGELVGSRFQLGKFFPSTRSAFIFATSYADELRLVEPALSPALKALKAKLSFGQEIGSFLLRLSYRAYISEDEETMYGSDTGELGVDFLGEGYILGGSVAFQKDNNDNQLMITGVSVRKDL